MLSYYYPHLALANSHYRYYYVYLLAGSLAAAHYYIKPLKLGF